MYFDTHFLRLKAEINNNINVDVLESNQIKFTEYLPSASITKRNSIARSCRRVSTDILFFGTSDFGIDNPALSCGSLIVFLIITYIIPAAVQIPF